MIAASYLKIVLPLAFVGWLTACGGPPAAPSRPETLELPQTPVKDQGQIGLCWAYGTTGFLESLLLKKNGIAVNLSEEALGFYRMTEELYTMSRRYSAAELSTADMVSEKTFEGLQGWDLIFQSNYNPGFNAPGALELIRRYGVIPEEAWSYKFKTAKQHNTFFQTVFAGFASLMQVHGQKNVTREMVMQLLAGEDAFGSRPPAEFVLNLPDGTRRTFSATGFAADFIGFTPDDYTYMVPDTQIGYAQLITAAKLALARGIATPLSYAIYKDQPNPWNGAFSVGNVDPDTLIAVGGHVVLITDFVNYGGKPGAISATGLQRELARPAGDLDFLVIKNSWNTRIQSPVLRLPGYHTIDQSYIRALTRHASEIAIVVPRDIAFQVRYEGVPE